MLKVSLSILTAVLFIGCSKTAVPLSSSEYIDYPVVYKANYDFKCSSNVNSISFKKGTVFGPVSLGGYMYHDEYTLPKDTLGLKVFIAPDDTSWYILIHPDGKLALNSPLVFESAKGVWPIMIPCNNIQEIPFTQVQSSTLR
ncbi:hypothetical protein N9A28_05905 [Sulfurimonas sp.]|nr:hypothetical protein [Sulfurimonas sp.]